ncbi:MAG: uridylate kinase, partial [Planctomycetota bacterium]
EFIDKISVSELEDRKLATLPFDPVVLEVLKTARLISQVQIVDGREPDLVEKALDGQHVGTIIHVDES